MSAMVEVLYKSPTDSRREAVISERIQRFGGRLTYREEPDIAGVGPVCLTYEFSDLGIAQEAPPLCDLEESMSRGRPTTASDRLDFS